VGGFAPIWHTTFLQAATDDGRTDGLIHAADRGGTGMTAKEVPKMPLAEPPLRDSRFGQAGDAGGAGNSASASTQRGPSMNESKASIGHGHRRWFGLIFPLPMVPIATRAAGENYDVVLGFALTPACTLRSCFASARHLSPGTDDTRCGMIGRSRYCWVGLALVGCWH
jgi:hypothetical protein